MNEKHNQTKNTTKKNEIEHSKNQVMDLGDKLENFIREGNETAALEIISGKKTTWKIRINRFFLVACHQKIPRQSIIKALLEQGANPNYQQNKRYAGLHLLTYNPFIDQNIVSLLLDKKANINIETNDGDTPLHFALSAKNSFENIQFLLEKKADPKQLTGIQNSVLHLAVYDIRILTYLKEQYQLDINVVNSVQETPLFFACINRNFDAVNYLITQGANCDIPSEDGFTCLHAALSIEYTETLNDKNKTTCSIKPHEVIEEKDLKIAHLLLKKAPHLINIKDKTQFANTVFHYAFQNKKVCKDMVDFFYQADFTVENAMGNLALFDLIQNKSVSPSFKQYFFKKILHIINEKKQNDISVKPILELFFKKLIVLYYHAKFKQDEILSWCLNHLIEEGIDANLQSDEGIGLLHTACSKLNEPFVKYLLEKNADINAYASSSIKSKTTPLFDALNQQDEILDPMLMPQYLNQLSNIVSLLIQHGAQVDAFNKPHSHQPQEVTVLQWVINRPCPLVLMLSRRPQPKETLSENLLIVYFDINKNELTLCWKNQSTALGDASLWLDVLPDINQTGFSQKFLTRLWEKGYFKQPAFLEKFRMARSYIDYLPMIEILLNQGQANPNLIHPHPKHHILSPLQLAITNRTQDIDLIKRLLAYKGDPNHLDPKKCSPLYAAVYENGSYELIQLLLNHGANISLQPRILNLLCLDSQCDLDTVLLILNKIKHYFGDHFDNQIFAPTMNRLKSELHHKDSIKIKRYKDIIKLIEHHFGPIETNQSNPLEYQKKIISKEDKKKEEFLLSIKNNASLNVKTLLIDTEISLDQNSINQGLLLVCASKNPQIDMIQMLLSKQGDPGYKNQLAQNSLHLCSQNQFITPDIMMAILNVLTSGRLIFLLNEADHDKNTCIEYYLQNPNARPDIFLYFLNALLDPGEQSNITKVFRIIRNSLVYQKDEPSGIIAINQRYGSILHWLCQADEQLPPDSKESKLHRLLSHYFKHIRGALEQDIGGIHHLDHKGRTFLHLACENPSLNFRVIYFLLLYKSNPNKQDAFKNTAFHVLCKNKKARPDLISLFLKYQADLFLENDEGHTAMDLLRMRSDLDLSQIQDAEGQHLLTKALQKKDAKTIYFLIEHYPEHQYPTFKTFNKNGDTLLHAVCREHNEIQYELLKKVLQRGADVQTRNQAQESAWQVLLNHEPVSTYAVNLFLKYAGQHLTSSDLQTRLAPNNQTLLHLAIDANHFNLFKRLIGLGMDLNGVDDQGETPLHRACRSKNPNSLILKLLLSKGARFDIKDHQGRCAGDYLIGQHVVSTEKTLKEYLLQPALEVLSKKTSWGEERYDFGLCDNQNLFSKTQLLMFEFLQSNQIAFYIHGSNVLPIAGKIFYTQENIRPLDRKCVINKPFQETDIFLKEPLHEETLIKLTQYFNDCHLLHAYKMEDGDQEPDRYVKMLIQCGDFTFDFYYIEQSEIRDDFVGRRFTAEVLWVDPHANQALYSLFSEDRDAKRRYLCGELYQNQPLDFFVDLKRVFRLFLAVRDFPEGKIKLQTSIIAMSYLYRYIREIQFEKAQHLHILSQEQVIPFDIGQTYSYKKPLIEKNDHPLPIHYPLVYEPMNLFLRGLCGRGAHHVFSYLLKLQLIEFLIPGLGTVLKNQQDCYMRLIHFFESVDRNFEKTQCTTSASKILTQLLAPLCKADNFQPKYTFSETFNIKFPIPQKMQEKILKNLNQSNIEVNSVKNSLSSVHFFAPAAKETQDRVWLTIRLLTTYIQGKSLSDLRLQDIEDFWHHGWKPPRTDRHEWNNIRKAFFLRLENHLIEDGVSENDDRLIFIREQVFQEKSSYGMSKQN